MVQMVAVRWLLQKPDVTGWQGNCSSVEGAAVDSCEGSNNIPVPRERGQFPGTLFSTVS